jgi:hypothetical protein
MQSPCTLFIMKLCPKCGKEKDRQKAPYCKDCLTVYQKERYALRRKLGLCFRCPNKCDGIYCDTCKKLRRPSHRKRQSEKRYNYNYREVKLWCVNYLGGRCTLCNRVFDCVDVYDFHHIDRTTKESTIAQLISRLATKEELVNELNKCRLFCANCHRIHHHEKGYKY